MNKLTPEQGMAVSTVLVAPIVYVTGDSNVAAWYALMLVSSIGLLIIDHVWPRSTDAEERRR